MSTTTRAEIILGHFEKIRNTKTLSSCSLNDTECDFPVRKNACGMCVGPRQRQRIDTVLFNSYQVALMLLRTTSDWNSARHQFALWHFEALANGTITEKIIDDLRAPPDTGRKCSKKSCESCHLLALLTTGSISAPSPMALVWTKSAYGCLWPPAQQYHAPSDVHGPIAAMEGHSAPRDCSTVPCKIHTIYKQTTKTK